MDAKSILITKVWLTIIGVMHLLMGVIVNYMENGSEDNLAGFGFFAMISFYLLYVAFMTADRYKHDWQSFSVDQLLFGLSFV